MNLTPRGDLHDVRRWDRIAGTVERRARRRRSAAWPWPTLRFALEGSLFFLCCAVLATVGSFWEFGGAARVWECFAAGAGAGMAFVLWWMRRDFRRRCARGPAPSASASRYVLAIGGFDLILNTLAPTAQAAIMGFAVAVMGGGALYLLALGLVRGRQRTQAGGAP